MQELFWDEAKGGYFMSVQTIAVAADAAVGDASLATFMPAIGQPKDIVDGALPSGNAVALHALARLARRPGERGAFLQVDERANALLAAFANPVNRAPSAFPYILLAAVVLADGQSGPFQYAAHGDVAVYGQVHDRQLSVNITIQPGWHINANQPLTDNLIPTVIRTSEGYTSLVLSEVSYPPPLTKTLGFQSEELALYEGSISITANLNNGSDASAGELLRLSLQLQACDNEICLPPEQLALQVPVSVQFSPDAVTK